MAPTRREVLASMAGAGIGFGLGAFSHTFPLPSPRVGPDWRPGKETFVPSTCLLCPAHCGIRARLVDGELSRIDGNPLHPVSQGGICPKGSAGIQLLYHPGRLKGPVRRVGAPGSGAFAAVSWDAALDQVAIALRSARDQGAAGTVEWIVGDLTGLVGDLVRDFCSGYGTERIAADDYRDGSSDVMRLCQGIDLPPAYDLGGSDLVLSFGAGLSEAWWALPQASRARDSEPGERPRWVQVDVRLSRSAASADQWIPVKPGTYGSLAMGMIYFMLKEGLYESDYLSRSAAGWEDWTDETGKSQTGFRRLVLRHALPDNVSAATGVPVAQIVALAKAFGRAARPVALWDQAVSWRTGGLADALAIHALNILGGRLNRPGGVLVQAPPPLAGPISGRPGPAGANGSARPPMLSATWPRRPGNAGASSPRVLFLYYSNPAASAANSEEVRKALAGIPLVVSFSPFLDESARFAHLVLPDHTYLERWQDAPAPPAVAFPVWGVVQPARKPLHDTRATGDVLLDLAGRVGGRLEALARRSSMEQQVRERGMALAGTNRGSAFVPPYRQGELRELEGRGWWLSSGQPVEEQWKTILSTGGWFDPFYDYHDRSAACQNPDGRAWVFPADARRRLAGSREPLAEGFLPLRTDSNTKSDGAEQFPLRLVPYRILTLASGGTPLMPWLLENVGVLTGDSWALWVEVNPETARELGLRPGQRVRVESSEGAFLATLRFFRGAQPGVVNVPYGLQCHVEGWGDCRGANPLAAVGDRVDPTTGLPDWYSTRVRLVAV